MNTSVKERDLIVLLAHILDDVSKADWDAFSDWAISGFPIRTKEQKATIIEEAKLLAHQAKQSLMDSTLTTEYRAGVSKDKLSVRSSTV